MGKGNSAAALLEVTGLGAVLRRLGTWTGVLVLNHHRVGDGTRWETGRDVWSATADQLDEQARFLVKNFDVVSPDELEAGIGQLRGRHVALTFDDGYRECYDVAYPILRAHGVSAAFFCTTGFIDGVRAAWWDEITWMVARSRRATIDGDGWLPSALRLREPHTDEAVSSLVARYKTLREERAEAFLDYVAEATGSGRRNPAETRREWLSWDMARDMRRGGMVFGGHTVTHPMLARQTPETQRSEVLGCLRRLEEELGERPTLFSYPDGTPEAFDATTKGIVRDCGVLVAFRNDGRVAAEASWDPLAVPRVSLGPAVSPRRFRAVATLPRFFVRG